MALSYNFFPTRDTIITAALRRVRAYDPEDTSSISAIQFSNAGETMDFLLSNWQALGLPIWCRKISPAKTLSATGSYTIGSGGSINVNRPLAIMQAWLRDSTTAATPIDIPLNIVSQQEYYLLSSKSSTGRPVYLYYDAAYDGLTNQGATAVGTINLWPVPDTNTITNLTLYTIYQRPLLDFNSSADALDMPQEWYEAIRLNLALKISTEYGIQAQDYDRLKVEAKEALELALNWDIEQVSVFFAPDTMRAHAY
jgi:hypothetical protein